MALDKTLEFSDKQSVAASAVSTVVNENSRTSKNVWGTTISNQIGGMSFNVTVTTTLVGASDLTVTLNTKAASASLTASSGCLATIVVPQTSAAGYKASVVLPEGTERLLHLGAYLTDGGSITAGNVNVWLGLKQELID